LSWYTRASKYSEVAAAVEGFVAAAAWGSLPDDAILVRAYQGSMATAWAIDRRDAKRFFRNRDTGLAADGKRRRVLHYVAPFERVVGNRSQAVREHYRGERGFRWNGYRVAVSGLGFHHDNFFDAPLVTFECESDEPVPRGFESMRTSARKILAYYNRPRFLSAKRKAA
jgi:hypothetical protein